MLSDPAVTVNNKEGHLHPLHFYKQSPKHRTFRARCWFNSRQEPDQWAHIRPQSADDLVRMLGLSGEEELPALLQGWSRLPDTRVAGTEHMIRWAWNDLSEGHVYVLDDELKVPPDVSRQGFMEAKVSLNSQSYSASALCC